MLTNVGLLFQDSKGGEAAHVSCQFKAQDQVEVTILIQDDPGGNACKSRDQGRHHFRRRVYRQVEGLQSQHREEGRNSRGISYESLQREPCAFLLSSEQ